jgi:Raf kinase inhibitor-like YbhB/YbcL family protein
MHRTAPQIVTALTVAALTLTAANAHEIWISGASRASSSSSPAAAPRQKAERVMQVTSKVISSGAEFPKRNTCQGADVSPDLAWSGAPAGAKSFALILDDPDAPSGTFTHWLAWDIPAATHELLENLPRTPQLPGGGSQGRNDFGKVGYNGPCPPPGKPHRYYVRLFALDTALSVKPGASRGELEQAMKGHVLAEGELMARFAR